jgi:hypothetical protein
MASLGGAISEAVILDYGRRELIRRLSDPFWFQAFGAVLGMDWHSSGITTSVMGALKRTLGPKSHELGVFICGGRGRQSRRTPDELVALGNRTGLDADHLVNASRLAARVDNNAVADGFQIYLHSFIATIEGDWAVVQQGMNDETGMARRYHWLSESVRSFVVEPHSGIAGEPQGCIMNLVDRNATPAQAAILELFRQSPEKNLREIRKLVMPRAHALNEDLVDLKRLGAVLTVAYERNLSDFASALLLEKLGPRTLQSVALVAEVIHGTPTRFNDPARFSFAHGGKDRHPFPVPTKVYDETIRVLGSALERVKVGDRDKSDGLKRMHNFVRQVEKRLQPRAIFEKVIQHEERISPSVGGMSVFGPAKKKAATSQLTLFE